MNHIQEFIDETLNFACAELAGRFGQDNNVRTKKDSSLVTDADLASEKIILNRISSYFPNDAIISEEAGQKNLKRTPGQRVWIIDPLDGTTNFANGFPFFCVSIGLGQFTKNGGIEMIAGGIGDPIHQNHFLAEKGLGAKLNGKTMQIVNDRPIPQCFLVTGFYYTSGQDLDREIECFRKIAQKCQSIRRDGAAALDLALVASGVYDGFWERGLKIWDVAAGSLLVTESGGQISNYPEEASSASLITSKAPVSFNLEGDGIIVGTRSVMNEVRQHLSI